MNSCYTKERRTVNATARDVPVLSPGTRSPFSPSPASPLLCESLSLRISLPPSYSVSLSSRW